MKEHITRLYERGAAASIGLDVLRWVRWVTAGNCLGANGDQLFLRHLHEYVLAVSE